MSLPTTSRIGSVGARLGGAIGLLAVLSLTLQAFAWGQGAPALAGPAVPLLRFFSLFSVLAGIAVAVASLAVALRPDGAGFASHPAVRGAAALYAAVVMVAYGMVLQVPWVASGAQLWADLGLNFLIPILFLSWWVWCVPHGGLRVVHLVAWIVPPVALLMFFAPAEYRVPALVIVIGMLLVLIDRTLAEPPAMR
jgi:hypothetical protein